MKQEFAHNEPMMPGHLACQGCGGTIIMKHALQAIGPDMVLVIPACCWAIIPGNFPYTTMNVPVLHTAFATTGAAASGVRAGLDLRGKQDTKVLAFAGDGGTFDIGIQSLSGAAERNEDIIYICYDNEAYMNTGVQRSSATPEKAWTTTTPVSQPKASNKKDIIRIMAGHKIPYCATANIAYPQDFIRKVETAARVKGTAFIHALSPCPSGWKIPSDKAIESSRLATQSRVFPLYEVYDGEDFRMTLETEAVPVVNYLRPQGRFRHLTDEDYEQIQTGVDLDYDRLLARAAAGEAN
ncbi:MAG TPA: pyruvate synthase subunit beta [Desulfobacteraceae bacterium]|nr:pyruvate synthase subunit beta [Desulfobacteraceae bacterium]